ncbi:hypothetical protein ASZ90_013845 [hydrocarbon metagenome]|uniref:Uncharacterized protein n=1 Tax=hydrocarbon metagenome TaxID=938273 RepID=A0A0W8F6I9_9ZZZZ
MFAVQTITDPATCGLILSGSKLCKVKFPFVCSTEEPKGIAAPASLDIVEEGDTPPEVGKFWFLLT